MVRAAATGAIDYSRADPTSKQWRLHQHLILSEMRRQEDVRLLENVHQHWLAYLAHGNLTEDSFKDVKEHASELMAGVKSAILPWVKQDKTKTKNDTIDEKNRALAERYKAFKAKLDAENAAFNASNG